MARKPSGKAGQATQKNAGAAPKKTHINAKIDEDLKKEMKVFCAERDVSIQDFLTEAIQKAMHEARLKEKRKS